MVINDCYSEEHHGPYELYNMGDFQVNFMEAYFLPMAPNDLALQA